MRCAILLSLFVATSGPVVHDPLGAPAGRPISPTAATFNLAADSFEKMGVLRKVKAILSFVPERFFSRVLALGARARRRHLAPVPPTIFDAHPDAHRRAPLLPPTGADAALRCNNEIDAIKAEYQVGGAKENKLWTMLSSPATAMVSLPTGDGHWMMGLAMGGAVSAALLVYLQKLKHRCPASPVMVLSFVIKVAVWLICKGVIPTQASVRAFGQVVWLFFGGAQAAWTYTPRKLDDLLREKVGLTDPLVRWGVLVGALAMYLYLCAAVAAAAAPPPPRRRRAAAAPAPARPL